MTEEELLALAADTANALLHADHGYPFGPEVDVWKFAGKVFLLTSTMAGPARVTVKGDPEDVTHLVEAYAELERGYHMNKRHWLSVRAGAGIDPDLVADLVKNSYDLVAHSIPASRRPQASPIVFSTGEPARR